MNRRLVLGHVCYHIVAARLNGYMATVTNLKNPVNKWRCGATPISYYYFIRLIGRKASHVALECALQSHPNMVILGEEVAASKLTIFDITKQICDVVQARAEKELFVYRKSMASMPKVFLLRISLLSFHHGHLHSEFLPPFIRKQLNFPSVLRQNSSSFLLEDVYRNPGPLQFEGPSVDSNPISLCVEDQDYMAE
ncbi:Pyrophosphate--fructose 6-phosphate 1-phosphotransferase subunit alpha 2 [Zea mays]|uniref:Pyrophosphate--fructose 6-phosphate 1-phosphotransferase subunit alpha 2 n=1 Tax=Zea mays TaxID=4577 RepID=A0A1D6EFP9_MAIZE|nr:Pyrophosphate--fructose 6-phosphate 1-phosphotransferase subunit alpha 2 [Zea mays]